jgi:tyrosine-protein kinase Etk/Wzc
MDPYNSPIEETLDLKRYFFLFLRNWYWIAISVFMGLFVAYLVNRYSEQVFQIRTSILVGGAEGRRMGRGVQTLMRELNLAPQAKRIENEIAILKSYTLARKAIDELPDFKITYVAVGRRGIAESKMYIRSPFVVVLDTASTNPIGQPISLTILNEQEYQLELNGGGNNNKTLRFGEHYQDGRHSFTLEPREAGSLKGSNGEKFYFVINSEHSLALTHQSKLVIEHPDKQGSILNLSTSGFVAVQEAHYLNKLVEVYIRNDLEEMSQTAINTLDFIDEQLDGITDSLRRAELMLQNFRAGKGIIDLSSEGRALLERLERLYTEKNLLTLQVEYFKYMETYLKEKRNVRELVSPASIGIEEASIASIVSQLNQQQMERDALLLSVSGDNIQVQRLNQSIASLTALLYEKIGSMREINRIRIGEINRQITEQESSLRMLPITERELLNMERKFSIHEKFYTYLVEKRIEAGIAKASNVSENRVIDTARGEMSRPVKPNRKMNYMIGFMIGLIIPAGIILLLDQLNNSIQDPNQVTKATMIPMIGTIGNNPFDSVLPIFDKPKSAFSESFRALRTNLDFFMAEKCNGVILVTSTISSEGKSFIASNLAASLAMLGKRTILLGLDLRKPKVHNLFGLDNGKGVSTFLIGRDSIDEIIVSSNVPNLSIIPAGPIPPNPAELIASEKLDELIDSLRKNYEYILIDSPPVAVVTDAVLISRLSCVTLFVMRHRYTSRNVLPLVENLSKTSSIKNMALLLNDFRSSPGYGYNYGYGYGVSYGYGYSYGDNHGYYSDEEKKSGGVSLVKRLFKG